jgi:hypothetical protein
VRLPPKGHARSETRAEKDARAFGRLPNKLSVDPEITPEALVLLAYRLTFVGRWVLNWRDVQKCIKRGFGERVFWRAMGILKGKGLIGRHVTSVAGVQGPGEVVNDELHLEPYGEHCRRVERKWFGGELQTNALACLLFIRAVRSAQPWRIANRFDWSLPTVRRAAANLISLGLVENVGTKQHPNYVSADSRNAQSKNRPSNNAHCKKRRLYEGTLPYALPAIHTTGTPHLAKI